MLTKQGDARDPDSWILEAHPLVQAGVRKELDQKTWATMEEGKLDCLQKLDQSCRGFPDD